jgi:hypothetical protein
MMYRLNDPDVTSEWFQKVEDELRDFEKIKAGF